MTIEELHDWASAEFGGPAIGALPAFPGDKLRPHKGGGGSSTTTQSIPKELKPLASSYASKAMDLSNKDYSPYTGQRFADWNSTQANGIDALASRAQGGDQTINAGANYLQGQLNAGERGASGTSKGGISTTANPVGNVSATANPYGSVSAEQNQYQGQNPYLDQMVGKAQDSVRSQFNTAAVNSGSFGNSGLQEQFQKGLSDTASQMYGADYANTQQLAEAGINRGMQAQQFNAQMGNDLAHRSDQAQQFNSQQGANYAQRNDQNQQFNKQYEANWDQRNDQVKQAQDANQLSAAQLGLQYGNQAYTDADQLLKVGQIQNDQHQQWKDFDYQQFQEQQNDPYKKLAAMSGVFSSGIGGTSTSKQSGGGK